MGILEKAQWGAGPPPVSPFHIHVFQGWGCSSAPPNMGRGHSVCFLLFELHRIVLMSFWKACTTQNLFLQTQISLLGGHSLGNIHHLTTSIFSWAHQEFIWVFYSQQVKSRVQLKQLGGPLIWSQMEHPEGIKGKLSNYPAPQQAWKSQYVG